MKNKIWIAVAAVAIIGILAGFMRLPGGGGGSGGGDTANAVRTITLEKGSIAASVSATGTVYSTESTNVYSHLNHPVKKVHVSVGDKVKAGDTLAELDSSSLESDIAQKNASISASQASAGQKLASAQKDLETYKRNLQENYDTNLLNAQSSLISAEQDVESAKRDVNSAELDVNSANADLVSARRRLREARDDGETTDAELNDMRATVVSKEISVEKAEASLEKAKATVEKAESNLEKAKKNLEAANVGSGDTISDYEDSVKSAQLATNVEDQLVSLQKLQSDLEKCVITAPVSGTVTSVSAVEGASGNGLLFVIQDAENLKVVTNIKEYDIDSVATGNKVTIKSDATGDRTFEGKLTKIAPTSIETAASSSTDSTDAEYESEVAITSKDGGLRIGMNARLNIITEEKTGVYSVPYEAIGTQNNGDSYIWVASLQEDGKYIAEAVTVQTGLETDLYTEISGDGLTDGMTVVRDASSVQAGDEISVQQRPGGAEEGATGQRQPGAAQQGAARQGSGGGPQVRVQMGG